MKIMRKLTNEKFKRKFVTVIAVILAFMMIVGVFAPFLS